MTRLRRALFLAFLLCTASGALAESRLIFPRIVFQGGRFSGIAIVNPTAGAVEVTLRAYGADGALFAGTGVTNPRTTTIPAGSQYSAVATEIFTPPASVAEASAPTLLWLEATAPADGLTGFFLDGSTALDSLDGSNLAGAGTDLVLPLVENTPPSTTEVAIVNPDTAAPATVTLDFFRTDGSLVATRSAVLPKRGGLFGPLSSLFPLSYDGVAAIHLRSDRPVVAFGYVSRTAPASLVAIAAQNYSLPARTLYFPQLAEGSDWATSIAIHNFSSAQILVTLTAYQADGTLFGPPAATNNPVTRTIEANGILRASARSLFGFPASPLRVGWIKAEASDTAINGYVEYGAGSNRALVSAQLEPTTRAIFSQQATAPPYYTGLAILNSGSLTANVEIVSSSRTSTILGKTQRVLKPRQREALLVEQWVPSAANVTGGSLFVKSDLPVVVTQLFGTIDLSALANVPPQAVPASFNPGAAIPAVRVSPPLAVVEAGKSQRFSSSGATGLTWAVDGAGAETTRGSVTSDGLYTAPAVAPQVHTLTVKATSGSAGLSAGASVDIIERGSLASGLTQVTAVAYLASLQRFVLAEQLALSAARPRAATASPPAAARASPSSSRPEPPGPSSRSTTTRSPRCCPTRTPPRTRTC
jgi:hypothetical protein